MVSEKALQVNILLTLTAENSNTNLPFSVLVKISEDFASLILDRVRQEQLLNEVRKARG